MKKLLVLVLSIIILTMPLSGCEGGYEYFELELLGEYTKELAGTQLNVYNWGEYISDGNYDLMNVNKEFEKLTGIKVNYTTFESNETMYSQLKSGGVSYDIVIPSDYMIERLIKEKMLKKIDTGALSNYKLIDDSYKGLYFDKTEEYSVPFNVGMVGIIYNTKHIKDIEHSWNVLWDSKYKNMSLNFNNPRDAFMTAQMLLGQDLNSTNKSDWDKAAKLLKKQKANLQSYVMDEVYGKMETGEASVAPYYAGDFLTMYETNEDLAFFYPEEGTNIFVDSICIPDSSQNYEAALIYINFLLEPQVALHNAEYIGYASPNTAVINNEEYYYYGNEILYPKQEDMPTVQYYHDIDEEIRKYYEELWLDIKLY
ncbi:MAG: ABC transporter substrate-binding protein [Ruminococcaceae bacterium]|nr:ABC transporter substrate-binding protein [Oscillospiraceae bacterium]